VPNRLLHERPDFEDLVVTVGERLETNPALIEKDYWVTEALRVVANDFREGVVFKGGTSLSKGWGLIRRFSEDIDLLVRSDGSAGSGRSARDRYMKQIEASVGEVRGLKSVKDGSRSERGISRTAVLEYEPRTRILEGLRPTIILEMGIRGGVQPMEVRTIRSMLGNPLESAELDDRTLQAFEIPVLHPRRTLVEKLFAVHSACELWAEGRETALQRQGRHFYDLYFLLADGDIATFVGSDSYRELIREIDAFGREYFPRDHRSPPEMRFADSRAFAPTTDLRAAIADDYNSSAFLFFGEAPDLDSIYKLIAAVRERM
jgi:Nucleotidyl transferase AbiEii toxin, Type IV TA system